MRTIGYDQVMKIHVLTEAITAMFLAITLLYRVSKTRKAAANH
jgi:hypothetical protein